jgi:hypothetical protein
MKPRSKRAVAILSAALAGCATPPEVYELADKSSASAALFAQHLGALGAQSRQLAERRAMQIASMDAFNAEMRAEYERDLAISRKVGDSAGIKTIMDDVGGFRTELEKIEQAGRLSQDARRQEIMKAYVELAPNSKAVRDVSNTLSGLAQKESRAERAKFLAGFAQQVRTEAKGLLEKDDKTAEAANKLLDKLKADLTSDAKQ